MTAHHMARTAYAGPAAPTRTTRSIEYDAFVHVTRKLRAATPGDDTPSGRDVAALAQAVHDNRRLWTTLAADLADQGNALPESLRARLIYLAEFTRVHSSRVLAGRASPAALVEVNTAVMRGLRGDAGAAGAA